jgi:tetratricopeptide (TPR) repeat protein
MDFGLVRRHWSGEREVVDLPATLGGTLAYMSPEQCRGDRIDARADLYALGCVLYETIVGQPPFLAPTSQEVMNMHAFEEPLRPSHLVRDVAPELDDLVMRLLAKRPGDRIGYASDAAAILGHVNAEGWPTRSMPAPRNYLYHSEVYGRQQPLAVLLERVGQMKAGVGGLMLVSGDSGIGKTALLAEVVSTASSRDIGVVVGECAVVGVRRAKESYRTGPLGPLARYFQKLADTCTAGGAAVTARLIGEQVRVLAPYEPALAQVPGAASYPEPVALVGEPARARLFAAILHSLQNLARERPVLLVLDDLHWADDLTLKFLATIPPNFFQENPVVIVGSVRSGELGPEIAAIRAAPSVHWVEMESLGRPAIASMVRDMLGLSESPDSLTDFLVTESEGNPFFVAEYLRAAVSENLFSRDRRGRWALTDPSSRIETLPLPRSLHALVAHRLDGLSAWARSLIQVAAVIGREVTWPLLWRISQIAVPAGVDESSLLSGLRELVGRQILEEVSDGSVRFVHDRLREAAYETTAPGRRRKLHVAAATALEQQADEVIPAGRGARRGRSSAQTRADKRDQTHRSDRTRGGHGQDVAATTHWSTLADHWRRAGDPSRAFGYFVLAGQGAREAFSNEAAARHLQSAAAAFMSAARAGKAIEAVRFVQVLETLGEVQSTRGQHAEARRSYTRAISRAARREDRARLLRKFGKTWAAQHKHRQALENYRQAQAALGRRPTGHAGATAWWQEWIEIQNERIWAFYWLKQLHRMEALISEVGPQVRRFAGHHQRAHYYQCWTALRIRQERYRLSKTTLKVARMALAAVQPTGDAKEIAAVHFGLAFSRLFSGQIGDAARDLRSGLSSVEPLGDIHLKLRYLAYLTMAERLRRRTAATVRHAKVLAELAPKVSMFDYMGSAASQLAWVSWRKGDADGAARHVATALETWKKCPIVHPFQWTAHWPGLAIALSRGDLPSATFHALEMISETQQRLPSHIERELSRAIKLSQDGKRDRAMGCLTNAKRLAMSERLL